MLSSVTGDAQRAIDCFRQALLIYQNSDEPLDLKFATVMFEMGTLLSQRNEYKDAANCYKFALEIRKNKLQDSFIVARTHYSLGVTLASQELRANITAAASSHLEEALRICQKECGKDNYQAAIIIHAMGVLDERKGDFNAASVWFTMELNMRKVLSGHGAFLVTKAMSRDVFRDTSTHVFDSSRRSF
jgi:tetratricopeptide (TPR) repeat protein